jgi:hypothetical protein
MVAILRAYGRALRSMLLPGMLKHFLWPVLASAVLWVVAGLALWGRLARVLVRTVHHWSFLSARLSSGSGAESALSASIHFARQGHPGPRVRIFPYPARQRRGQKR